MKKTQKQQKAPEYLFTIKFYCFKYSNFELLLYCICWGYISDNMVLARSICPSAKKELSFRPIQISMISSFKPLFKS